MPKEKVTYVVESIQAKRITKQGKVQYLIKWQGYPSDQCTWEPIKHLAYVQSMVDQFEKMGKKENTLQKLRKIKKASRSKSLSSHGKSSIKCKKPQQKKVQQSSSSLVQSEQHPSPQKYQQNPIPEISNEPENIFQKPQQIRDGGIQQQENHSVQRDLDFSSQNSDVEEDEQNLQVINIAKSGDKTIFQVKFPHSIEWVSHERMVKSYPRELIQFYDKYLTFD